MASVSNKVVLITGGSKGIGYGVAKALIDEHANVAITSRSQEDADNAAAELNQLGKGTAIGIAADVRNAVSQQQTVEKVLAKWGTLDVLIANAGVGFFASVDALTTDQWLETIDTNLTGVFFSIKASVAALKESRGYIITMASLAGANFFAGASAYNASKLALLALHRLLCSISEALE